MASLCRSTAIMKCARSVSKTLTTKTIITPKSMPSLFPCTKRANPFCTSRIAMVLGCVESLMPLHSAIASARLKSSIAADSSCWSWLSQGKILIFSRI
ncbi:hypothetical protein IFM89_011093 [Coptis chinensis]|uniref:Uncharacterized protein n=1 Tax=Coptis chinensis TaxID=261450 RepID=A0A835IPD2_9MAGN|nr:hypothetical protein IFM89_011093 [Coptis chinensis]